MAIERSTEELIEDLSSRAWELRRDACEDLGRRREKKGVPYVINLLKDSVGAVRFAAVQTLGRIGGDEVVQPLLSCLADESFGDHAPVLEAIGNMRRAEAIPYLIHFLHDQDPTIRGIANTSLMVTTGQALGFRATAPEEEREDAIMKWQAWWEANEGTFVPPGTKKKKKAKKK